MKGLLQSKRFRKNLKKWLCMYVGTLLILTTVITYSKYISSLGVNDEARVTKFDVEINQIGMQTCNEETTTNCCTGSKDDENLSCITKDYRPTEVMSYDFKVSYDFEVTTTLTVSIYVNNKFKVNNIDNIKGLANETTSISESKDGDYNIISITKSIPAATNGEDAYHLNVSYDNYNFANYEEFNGKVVYVNYSASQEAVNYSVGQKNN